MGQPASYYMYQGRTVHWKAQPSTARLILTPPGGTQFDFAKINHEVLIRFLLKILIFVFGNYYYRKGLSVWGVLSPPPSSLPAA